MGRSSEAEPGFPFRRPGFIGQEPPIGLTHILARDQALIHLRKESLQKWSFAKKLWVMEFGKTHRGRKRKHSMDVVRSENASKLLQHHVFQKASMLASLKRSSGIHSQ